MAYTPEFTQHESGIVRRIAWAMGVPMTVAYKEIIHIAVKNISKKRICLVFLHQMIFSLARISLYQRIAF